MILLVTIQFRTFCLLVCLLKILTNFNIILRVVMYECETWPLTLREENRLSVRNRVQRIFLPTRDEVTGGWTKLHNEELHDLCFSRDIIRVSKTKKVR
jgi:hypothetical protein